jgi:hypothetical protein
MLLVRLCVSSVSVSRIVAKLPCCTGDDAKGVKGLAGDSSDGDGGNGGNGGSGGDGGGSGNGFKRLCCRLKLRA